MTIIIDPIKDNKSKWTRLPKTTHFCHMATDDHTLKGLEELHVFAERLGLKRTWFQDMIKRHPHYDLTPTRRAIAVKLGAEEVDEHEFIRRVTWTPQEIATRFLLESEALNPGLFSRG